MPLHKMQQHDDEPDPISNPADLIKKIASEAKSGFKQPEPGLYSGIVIKVEPVEFESGIAIRISTLLDYRKLDEEIEVFKDSQIFKITKPDRRTPDEWGPDFYGRFMAKLGFAADNRGQEAWDEIADSQPGVAIKISIAKDSNYRNRQIMGLLDDDDEGVAFIRDYLDSTPY